MLNKMDFRVHDFFFVDLNHVYLFKTSQFVKIGIYYFYDKTKITSGAPQ